MSQPSSEFKTVKVPQSLPLTTTRFRPPKKNLPQTKVERDNLLKRIRAYVESERVVPPMPLDELEIHARKICGRRVMPTTSISITWRSV
jgi:hypothetical protein